jgi:electron transfer flavoprotein alpha subunit
MSARIVAVVPSGAAESRLEPLKLAVALAGASSADVVAIVTGADPARDAEAAAAFGPGAVWTIADRSLGDPPAAEPLLQALQHALAAPEIAGEGGPALVLLPVGAIEEEVAARLASRIGGVALGRCRAVQPNGNGGVVVERSAYGGAVAATLETDGRPLVAVVPPGAAAAIPRHGPSSPARAFRLPRPLVDGDEIVRKALDDGREARLDGVPVIVSGGRGIGGQAGFAELARLAGRLGGAVGGSLPAADAGWVPVARQIGQSGKYVGPELYVAVGISGTTQHLAGIDPKTRIVAINSDREAPIFAVAELGIVGDWREILPALLRELGADD